MINTLFVILQGAAGKSFGLGQIVFLAVIILIVIIIIVNGTKKKENVIENVDSHNKIINITLIGGIIGIFSSSPINRLNNAINKENQNGWRVVQIIPSESGNIFLWIFRLLLLLITLFLYTEANGYYVILEKLNKVKDIEG